MSPKSERSCLQKSILVGHNLGRIWSKKVILQLKKKKKKKMELGKHNERSKTSNRK